LHYSKIENWGCVLYTGVHYIRLYGTFYFVHFYFVMDKNERQ